MDRPGTTREDTKLEWLDLTQVYDLMRQGKTGDEAERAVLERKRTAARGVVRSTS